jgi:hypothetical protein
MGKRKGRGSVAMRVNGATLPILRNFHDWYVLGNLVGKLRVVGRECRRGSFVNPPHAVGELTKHRS